MDEKTLNKYLYHLKFIVISDAQTGNPIDIYFGFHLPNAHIEIFEEAKKQYASMGKQIHVLGGGRISKKDKFIVFYSTSQRYKRFDNEIVLSLAPQHPYFIDGKYIFLAKAGEEDFYKVIEEYKNSLSKKH